MTSFYQVHEPVQPLRGLADGVPVLVLSGVRCVCGSHKLTPTEKTSEKTTLALHHQCSVWASESVWGVSGLWQNSNVAIRICRQLLSRVFARLDESITVPSCHSHGDSVYFSVTCRGPAGSS